MSQRGGWTTKREVSQEKIVETKLCAKEKTEYMCAFVCTQVSKSRECLGSHSQLMSAGHFRFLIFLVHSLERKFRSKALP